MLLKHFLTLRGVQVSRKTLVPDGMGEEIETEKLTTLSHVAIWSPGQSQRYISDKMYRASTHVLVTLPEEYTFTNQDDAVIYAGSRYKITGPSDNVALQDKLVMTGLEKLS